MSELRKLLQRQIYSNEVLVQIAAESNKLLREYGEQRWYFLVVHHVVGSLIDNPNLTDPDTAEPVIEAMREQALRGLVAFEAGDLYELTKAANSLTEVLTAIP